MTVKRAFESAPERAIYKAICRMTGYQERTVRAKLESVPAHTKVRNALGQKWPEDVRDEIGAYTVYLARTLGAEDALADLYGVSRKEMASSLASASSNALVRTVLSALLSGDGNNEEDEEYADDDDDDHDIPEDTDDRGGEHDEAGGRNGAGTRIRIFVSHASANASLARAVVRLIEDCVEVPEGAIRCTSVDGYTLVAGDDPDTLRSEIRSCEVLVGVLTPESLSSGYVLMELGAAWAFGKRTCSFLAPGLDYGTLPGPTKPTHACRMDVRSSVGQFIDGVAKWTRLQPRGRAKSDAAIAHFLDEVARLLPAPQPEHSGPSTARANGRTRAKAAPDAPGSR